MVNHAIHYVLYLHSIDLSLEASDELSIRNALTQSFTSYDLSHKTLKKKEENDYYYYTFSHPLSTSLHSLDSESKQFLSLHLP